MDNYPDVCNRIHQAAENAALIDELPVADIVRFLGTGERPASDSNVLYSRARMELDAAYGRAEFAALRGLFDLLSELLPPETLAALPVGREEIRCRIEPMVRGLVPPAWQQVALNEIADRMFVLNLPGAKAGMEAELSTCFSSTARKVLWACFADYGLLPNDIEIDFSGISGGSYAHCRWSAFHSDDAYSDVIVHEAAHLLHYLKPELCGLRVPKTKERFVDVDFHRRELFAYTCEAYSCVLQRGNHTSRLGFAGMMRDDAFSFPDDQIVQISDLVAAATRARNGWRTIRDATAVSDRRQSQKDLGRRLS